jgi:1,4-alpha-glucan branching enzyme
VVCNFTPVLRTDYILGVPCGGFWRELANSDASVYGGSGVGNLGGLEARSIAAHGRSHSLAMTLPPLGVLMFKSESKMGSE